MAENFSQSSNSFTASIGTNFLPGNTTVSPDDALRQFRAQQDAWQPRTPLGMRLKELRAKFIAEGGQLLSDEQIEQELRERSLFQRSV